MHPLHQKRITTLVALYRDKQIAHVKQYVLSEDEITGFLQKEINFPLTHKVFAPLIGGRCHAREWGQE